jgi:hypothetical protein
MVNVAEGVKEYVAVAATYPVTSVVDVTGIGLGLIGVPVMELMKFTVPVGGLPKLPPEGLFEVAVPTNAVNVT